MNASSGASEPTTLLNGIETDLMALEDCLGRKGFQAVAGKAVEFVHDDRVERVTLRSNVAQHLLERFAFSRFRDAE